MSSNETLETTTCYKLETLAIIPSLHLQLLIVFIYSLSSVVSLIGNVVVIVVQVLASKSLSRNIRKYLIHLAVADILFGVLSVPFNYTNLVLGHWIFPLWLCPVAQYVQLLSIFFTSVTLTIVGFERYLATLYPFSNIFHNLKLRANFFLALTWIVGILYAIIPYEHTYASEFQFDNHTYYECNNDHNISTTKLQLFMIVNFGLTFAIPSSLMTFFYIAIVRKLNQNTKSLIGVHYNQNQVKINTIDTSHKPDKEVNHNSKTIKMLFFIILINYLCWTPIKLLQILLTYNQIPHCTETEFYTAIALYITFHWFAMASSFLNPIVYSFMSRNFRKDFCNIVYKSI